MHTIFRSAVSDRSLEHALSTALEPGADLFMAVANSSDRFRSLGAMGGSDRLTRLIQSAAWDDAALELLSIIAPHWAVKRVVRLDDEWLCTFGVWPSLPDELDDTVESTHASLPLALLGGAFLASRREAALLAARGTETSIGQAAVDCDDYR